MSAEKKANAVQIAAYLKDEKLIIIDPSSAFSNACSKILQDLGAPSENMLFASSYNKAVADIQGIKPRIILSEFQIQEKCGLDLLVYHKANYPNSHQRSFVIVTSSASESCVAEAAEEEVDAYILKPFLPKKMIDTLIQTFSSKIYPSDYAKQIQKGKQLIAKKDHEEAHKVLTTAAMLHDRPTLAHYYTGYNAQIEEELDRALLFYQKGRQINPIHYKCLIGEFDVLFDTEDNDSAYQLVKIITKNYPITPNRLEKFILLAVYTENTKDLEKYYEIYMKLDRKTPKLPGLMAAAMKAGAKYAIKANDIPRAVDYFSKGALVINRNPEYISAAVEILKDTGDEDAAKEIFELFPADHKGDLTHKKLEYLINVTHMSSAEIIENGKLLIEQGVKDRQVYSYIIENLVLLDKKVAAEDMVYQACKDFPELRSQFEEKIIKISAS